MTELADLYEDLRSTARRLLDRERVGHSLESTELVNTAFARLLGGTLRDRTLADPASVVAAAVVHMKRELVDHARRRAAGKRPDARRRVDLPDAITLCEEDPATLLAVDAALEALRTSPSVRHGARKAELLEHAIYVGLSESEISAATGIPKSTVNADL